VHLQYQGKTVLLGDARNTNSGGVTIAVGAISPSTPVIRALVFAAALEFHNLHQL